MDILGISSCVSLPPSHLPMKWQFQLFSVATWRISGICARSGSQIEHHIRALKVEYQYSVAEINYVYYRD